MRCVQVFYRQADSLNSENLDDVRSSFQLDTLPQNEGNFNLITDIF